MFKGHQRLWCCQFRQATIHITSTAEKKKAFLVLKWRRLLCWATGWSWCFLFNWILLKIIVLQSAMKPAQVSCKQLAGGCVANVNFCISNICVCLSNGCAWEDSGQKSSLCHGLSFSGVTHVIKNATEISLQRKEHLPKTLQHFLILSRL